MGYRYVISYTPIRYSRREFDTTAEISYGFFFILVHRTYLSDEIQYRNNILEIEYFNSIKYNNNYL